MTLKNFWTPQHEAKLHAWHVMQKIADQTKPAPCFTISREFGCQGYPLAEELISRLNALVAGNPWVVMGREMLEEVSALSGYTVDQIEKSQDTSPVLKSIFSMFLDSSRAEETAIFTHLRTTIRGFAKRGNCVLVGRGGVLVTQDLPNCIHLRLVAPYEFRLKNIMKTHGMQEREAKAYVDLQQQQRDAFVRRFVTADIADPCHYHLTINNERLAVDKMAELVEEYMIRYTNR